MNTLQIQISEKDYADLIIMLERGYEDLGFYLKHGSPQMDGYNDEDVAQFNRLGNTDLVKTLEESKSYLWSSGSGCLELEIPAEAVDDIAQSGDNEPACLAWLNQPSYLTKQLDEMDINKARHHLIEAGIDEVYKKSDADVRMYVLWMACHDINEEENDNA